MRFLLGPLSLLLCCVGIAGAEEIRVSDRPEALAVAIENAQPGDILRLAPIHYAGPIVVDRRLSIVGQEGSAIIGPGTGTVVSIVASDVRIEGLEIRGSGKILSELDSGIAVAEGTERVAIIDNELIGNLIGVDVQGGREALVSGNTIQGRTDLHRSERGAGIYVWNAPGLIAENNVISGGSDGIFITSANGAEYRGNKFHDVRFAIHSMYSNGLTVVGNHSVGNELGFAFMYSHHVTVEENISEDDRTHGFFLNFVNYSSLVANEVRAGGEKCLFVYNANKNDVSSNRFEGCDIGIHFTAGSEGNEIVGNAFVGNRNQVKYVGSRWVEWSVDGIGNHWSDQVSFDIDGNGIADSPYRPNDLVDRIAWSQPMSKLLMGSPAVQLIRWSQSRFPGLMPGGVIDSHPLMDGSQAGVQALSAPEGDNNAQ